MTRMYDLHVTAAICSAVQALHTRALAFIETRHCFLQYFRVQCLEQAEKDCAHGHALLRVAASPWQAHERFSSLDIAPRARTQHVRGVLDLSPTIARQVHDSSFWVCIFWITNRPHREPVSHWTPSEPEAAKRPTLDGVEPKLVQNE
jgi:hypothetical protein